MTLAYPMRERIDASATIALGGNRWILSS